eukprot:jgi/Botrbrau1/22074/Bobra.0206s0002.1
MATPPLTHDELVQIRKHVEHYVKADDRQAWKIIISTAVCLMLPIAAFPLCKAFLHGWVFSLVIGVCIIFRAMIFDRCFVIFHDCIHDSFFQSKSTNRWVGKIVGGIVSTDYNLYRRHHGDHHRFVVSDEDSVMARDTGITIFWTNHDWEQYTLMQKMWLRIARDPIIYFSVLSVYLGITQGYSTSFVDSLRPRNKIATYTKRTSWRWLSTADVICGSLLFGPGYALYTLASIWVAAAIGLVLVHFHHTANGSSFHGWKSGMHNQIRTSIEGSTLINLPAWMHSLYLNIAFHHIHHISPLVPSYKLKRCHDELDPWLWRTLPVIGIKNGLAILLVVQYDPDNRRFQPFAAYKWLHGLLS